MGGLLAFCLPTSIQAQGNQGSIVAEGDFGPKVKWGPITEVQLTNLQGEYLGRVQDVTLDLVNGRIVEILVVSDQFLRFGGKTVAVPPGALIPDPANKTYHINMSAELFKAAPLFDLDKWTESTEPGKVAAAYKYFGQVPNFLVPGEAPGRLTGTTGRPVTALGIVERMEKLINMNVDDMHNMRLGTLTTFVLDIPKGRILNAYITVRNGGDALIASTVVSPTMLDFNAKRDGLLLDVTKVEYSQQPHVIFESGANDQTAAMTQSATATAPTIAPLVQGTEYRDINITASIYKAIQSANLDPRGHVQVGTVDGRVTLRGNVTTQAIKDSIAAIAITAVRLENVDNQIDVTVQAQASL